MFIEILNNDVLNVLNDKIKDKNSQINNIRGYFMDCIKNKKCPNIRVHWADPTIISKTHKRYKELPFWLQKLQRIQEYGGYHN